MVQREDLTYDDRRGADDCSLYSRSYLLDATQYGIDRTMMMIFWSSKLVSGNPDDLDDGFAKSVLSNVTYSRCVLCGIMNSLTVLCS